jgi:hypothetical protein
MDLDGVLADFDRSIRDHGGDPGDQVSIWRTIASYKNFFRDLHPTGDGKQLWEEVTNTAGYRTAILTGASTEHRRLQKQAWCKEHLNDQTPFYSCRANLKAQYCNHGDILIDDNPHHRSKWEQAGGIFIHHTSAESTMAILRNYLKTSIPLPQATKNPPSKVISMITRRTAIVDDIIRKSRGTHKDPPTQTPIMQQRILHINAINWSECMDNPISTVLQQGIHDWTTKGSKHTIRDQLAAMNKETTTQVAQQLLDNENITPAQTLIQTISSAKQQKSKRLEMEEKLAAIRRRLIGDQTLWNSTVATTHPVMNTEEEREPGKDQAVKDLLQALKTHGEDEELPAEKFHLLWTGESAVESFGPTATIMME